jgi:hypothetical protein
MSMDMTSPKKPETLVYVEVQYDIFNHINKIIGDTGIPFYQLEIIINKLAEEVSGYARTERENALTAYKTELEAYRKATEEAMKAAEVAPEAASAEKAPSDEPIDTTTAEPTEE